MDRDLSDRPSFLLCLDVRTRRQQQRRQQHPQHPTFPVPLMSCSDAFVLLSLLCLSCVIVNARGRGGAWLTCFPRSFQPHRQPKKRTHTQCGGTAINRKGRHPEFRPRVQPKKLAESNIYIFSFVCTPSPLLPGS